MAIAIIAKLSNKGYYLTYIQLNIGLKRENSIDRTIITNSFKWKIMTRIYSLTEIPENYDLL